jgi:TetR/AcrR family transcriptional regulator of autoinduction and epiphytic fitness
MKVPSDQKRSAILIAALESFQKEGFHGTSMDAVAERANVSKRTVYNHFPSKDVLFDVVTDHQWSLLVPDGEVLPARDLPVEERLRELASRRLEVLLRPDLVGLVRTIMGDAVRMPELGRAYVGTRNAKAQLGLRALLEEEIGRKRLVIEQVDLAAGQFWGLALGPLFWPLVLGLRTPPDETEREIVVQESIATFMARYGGTHHANRRHARKR